ncbi:cytoskeletal protein binding protein [Savitreella phatthalungensis]
MAAVGICTVLYDYESQQPDPAQEDKELSITEGETLYVLERAEDGWWKVKKKAEGDEEEGDEGLVPANYVQDATPISRAVALYDYDRQTTEEITLTEGASIDVYDKEDSDWFLVGSNGQYGFAPSNYLEESSTSGAPNAAGSAAIPTPVSNASVVPPAPPLPTLAQPSAATAARAQTMGARAVPDYSDHTALESDHDDDDDDHRPAMPQRVASNSNRAPSLPIAPASLPISPAAVAPRPPQREPSYEQAPPTQPARPSVTSPTRESESQNPASRRFATWQVQEVEGKKKKRKGTLGLGNTEISWAPDRAQDSITTWPITSLATYSTEKKHVFIDLQSPPHTASFDFHAGSNDAAAEIGARLGEMVGAARAEGLREVASALNAPLPNLPAGSGLAQTDRGFPSRPDDEDDDEELAAGADLLPAGQFYATCLYDFEAQGDDEVTLRAGARVIVLDDRTSADWTKVKFGRREGVVPAAYLESSAPRKERKSRESGRDRSKSRDRSKARERDVAAGSRSAEKLKPQNTGGKSKPDPKKIRTWTDRSRSFKVEAQLLGCSDGKIHLHKVNGVKISVPVAKMCEEDLEYVEHKTGKVLRESSKSSSAPVEDERERRRREAATEAQKRLNDANTGFDWFDFFLTCGVDPQVCQRYTSAFERDNLTEQDIRELQPELLRRLGVREGDILKIGRAVDVKLGRARPDPSAGGSIIAEADGTLKNNTRQQQPRDVIDASQLKFEDNAWDEKPPAKPVRPQNTGAAPSKGMEDLSLLDQPLIPTPKNEAPAPQQQPAQTGMPSQEHLQSQNLERLRHERTLQLQQQQIAQQQQQIEQQQQILIAQRTGFIQQMQAQATGFPGAAPFQDPFKTGNAAAYQDPFKTGFAGGFAPQQTGFVLPMQTGFPAAPVANTNANVFAMQQTGYAPLQPQKTAFAQMQSQQQYQPQQNFPPQQTGFNPAQPYSTAGGALPPFGGQSLSMQPTGVPGGMMAPQQTGFAGFNQQVGPQPQMSAGMMKLQQMFTAAQQAGGPSAGASPFGQQQSQQQSYGFQPIAFGYQQQRPHSAAPSTNAARRANLNAASAANPFGF